MPLTTRGIFIYMPLTLLNTNDAGEIRLINTNDEGYLYLLRPTYLLLAETTDVLTAENDLELEIEHL
jgi:signal transduction histidine kinase